MVSVIHCRNNSLFVNTDYNCDKSATYRHKHFEINNNNNNNSGIKRKDSTASNMHSRSKSMPESVYIQHFRSQRPSQQQLVSATTGAHIHPVNDKSGVCSRPLVRVTSHVHSTAKAGSTTHHLKRSSTNVGDFSRRSAGSSRPQYYHHQAQHPPQQDHLYQPLAFGRGLYQQQHNLSTFGSTQFLASTPSLFQPYPPSNSFFYQTHNPLLPAPQDRCLIPARSRLNIASMYPPFSLNARDFLTNRHLPNSAISSPAAFRSLGHLASSPNLCQPLHVDCSVEYDLGHQPKIPRNSAPLLIIHPAYHTKLQQQVTQNRFQGVFSDPNSSQEEMMQELEEEEHYINRNKSSTEIFGSISSSVSFNSPYSSPSSSSFTSFPNNHSKSSINGMQHKKFYQSNSSSSGNSHQPPDRRHQLLFGHQSEEISSKEQKKKLLHGIHQHEYRQQQHEQKLGQLEAFHLKEETKGSLMTATSSTQQQKKNSNNKKKKKKDHHRTKEMLGQPTGEEKEEIKEGERVIIFSNNGEIKYDKKEEKRNASNASSRSNKNNNNGRGLHHLSMPEIGMLNNSNGRDQLQQQQERSLSSNSSSKKRSPRARRNLAHKLDVVRKLSADSRDSGFASTDKFNGSSSVVEMVTLCDSGLGTPNSFTEELQQLRPQPRRQIHADYNNAGRINYGKKWRHGMTGLFTCCSSVTPIDRAIHPRSWEMSEFNHVTSTPRSDYATRSAPGGAIIREQTCSVSPITTKFSVTPAGAPAHAHAPQDCSTTPSSGADYFSDFSSPMSSAPGSNSARKTTTTAMALIERARNGTICPNCRSGINSDCLDGFCASIWNKENLSHMRPIHV